MDQEFRNILRLIQRSDGDFSKLDLHDLLSEENLGKLFKEVVIAKMKRAEVEIISTDYWPASGKIVLPGTDSPRILITQAIDKNLGRIACQTPITWETLSELPETIFHSLLRVDWKERHGNFYSINDVRVTLIKKVLLIEKILTRDIGSTPEEWYLRAAYKWQETPESYQNYKNKKLKERGLLPGRNWVSKGSF